MVHHEYAGLAGTESPSGDRSSYKISNQITDFFVDTVVKRLAVLNLGENKDTYLRYAQDFQGDPSEIFDFWNMKELLLVFSGRIEICHVPGKGKEACDHFGSNVLEQSRIRSGEWMYGGCHPNEGKLSADIGLGYGSYEVEYHIEIPACSTSAR